MDSAAYGIPKQFQPILWHYDKAIDDFFWKYTIHLMSSFYLFLWYWILRSKIPAKATNAYLLRNPVDKYTVLAIFHNSWILFNFISPASSSSYFTSFYIYLSIRFYFYEADSQKVRKNHLHLVFFFGFFEWFSMKILSQMMYILEAQLVWC